MDFIDFNVKLGTAVKTTIKCRGCSDVETHPRRPEPCGPTAFFPGLWADTGPFVKRDDDKAVCHVCEPYMTTGHGQQLHLTARAQCSKASLRHLQNARIYSCYLSWWMWLHSIKMTRKMQEGLTLAKFFLSHDLGAQFIMASWFIRGHKDESVWIENAPW